jgi:hypothetical protein
MKLDFSIGTYTDSEFVHHCLTELYPTLIFYSCENTFQQDWERKKIPVRLMVGADKILIDQWQNSYVFTLPVLYQELESVFKILGQKEYFSFCDHGVCEDTLCDPRGQRILLRQKEAEVLAYLMQHPQKSKEDLLKDVWNYDPSLANSTHTLETHLSSLRTKLDKSSRPLKVEYDQEKYRLVGTISPS